MSSPQDWTACIEEWRADAEALSYEEALQAADLLLAELQSDTVPLADLQKHVVHGEVYLKHCEALLKVEGQRGAPRSRQPPTRSCLYRRRCVKPFPGSTSALRFCSPALESQLEFIAESGGQAFDLTRFADHPAGSCPFSAQIADWSHSGHDLDLCEGPAENQGLVAAIPLSFGGTLPALPRSSCFYGKDSSRLRSWTQHPELSRRW